MYVVIFTAEINQLDERYTATAERMRQLAMEKYGCTGFVACTEGQREIAVSYWPSQQQISAWKADAEHLSAQALGRDQWYKSYRVEVAEITRAYGSGQ